jgi:hypothetical protein
MPNQEIVKRLKQFNEKADRLMNLDFINLLLTTKPGVTIAAENERSVPYSELINEFVQVFGFFMPDGNKALFKKLSDIYRALAGFEQERDNMENVRAEINGFLDSPSNMAVSGGFSKREVMGICIHGALAEDDEEKGEIYNKWISEEITEAIIVNRFIGILVKVFDGITNMQRINNTVIAKLSS